MVVTIIKYQPRKFFYYHDAEGYTLKARGLGTVLDFKCETVEQLTATIETLSQGKDCVANVWQSPAAPGYFQFFLNIDVSGDLCSKCGVGGCMFEYKH